MYYILFLLLTFVLNSRSQAQNRYDIVICEIMADPSPPRALPEYEWIELKNTSSTTLDLRGWRITDATGQSGPMPAHSLAPDSFVIVCAAAALNALSGFGTTIAVTSFPSLANDGELLSLKSPDGRVIHSLYYSSGWYQNELKKEGGWSLEMIDTKNPCAGSSNWKASIAIVGGTPGRINSINGVNNDSDPPRLLRSFAKDSVTIILVFNEPLDSLSGATLSAYAIDGGLNFTGAMTLAPIFNEVRLTTDLPLQENRLHTITASNVADCKGNTLIGTAKIRAGRAVAAVDGDVIINEILFNPRPTAYDYIEVFNKSNKILDLSALYLANRNNSNAVSSITSFHSSPYYFFPGDYIVLTIDDANLGLHYLVKDGRAVLTSPSLPSFPDDKGTVLLLNIQGEILDEVAYSAKWHFKLIDNPEGIALEKIDPSKKSQDPGNWHSAASTAGFGTPGYKNSQYIDRQGIATRIEIVPRIFSPDNDGYQDRAMIQYGIDEPGYMANILIFDAAGRIVRNLVKNELLSTTGYWNWDGLNDKGQKLPIGTYIIFTQLFNLQGKKEEFKKVVVLAGKLN